MSGLRIGAKWSCLMLAAAAALAVGALREARADANWKSSSAYWQIADKCARSAQKQYPDYTREGNAKREAARQACLRASNLPTDSTPGQAPPPQAQR